MRRQHDSDSLLTQSAHGLPHCDAALRIESGARFIKKQNLGMMCNGASDLNALRKAARKLGWISIGSFREMKLGKQLVCSLPRLSARKPKIEAVKIDIFEDRACTIQGVVLRHHAYIAPRQRRRLHNVNAGDSHSSVVSQTGILADTDGVRLASAVGPNRPNNSP